MRYILTLLCLLMAAPVRGQIVEGDVISGDGQPVPGAHVVVVQTARGAVSDGNGHFTLTLEPGSWTIRISMIGFEPAEIAVVVGDDQAVMLPIVLKEATLTMGDEVVVHGRRADKDGHIHNHRFTSTEALIDETTGVNVIRRANYAWEPVIRGYADSRLGVRIDGMSMTPACVDRMDPVTSYVDTGNLERLEITRGAFDPARPARPGGQLNLVTSSAQFDAIWGAIESEYATASNQHVHRGFVNVAGDVWALRANASYRRAGDYRAGGGGVVPSSGFEKVNWHLDGARRLGEARLFRATYIGDVATDVGYPGLLMDTDRAASHVLGLEHRWTRPRSDVPEARVRIYHTRVDHAMSDYRRDVTTRSVMPDMYMPMRGETRTSGLTASARHVNHRGMTRLTAEIVRLDAFADMRMEPLDQSLSPMRLINVGGARFREVALSAEYERALNDRATLGGGIRGEFSDRTLRHDEGRRTIEALYPNEPVNRQYLVLALSGRFELRASRALRLMANASHSSRPPSHLEAYGYYVYQPIDGFFYHGRPDLRPEKSTQFELTAALELDAGGAQLTLFDHEMSDYITGQAMDAMFKSYANVGRVRILGAEARAWTRRAGGFRVETGLAYVHGHNLTHDEPLPLMPPLELTTALNYERGPAAVDIRGRFVAAQDRVARETTLETRTPAFYVVDLRGRLALSRAVQIQFGIENLVDRHYYEHLNPGQLPNMGRNVFLGVRLSTSGGNEAS